MYEIYFVRKFPQKRGIISWQAGEEGAPMAHDDTDITAPVLNIQKFSVNDGPGIRTTVFLKGCPLQCPWCSNPESQAREPQMEWNATACLGCRRCLELLAPHGARASTRGDTRHVSVASVDATSAAASHAVRACPAHALTITGEVRTLEDVLAVCLQDVPFYEESDGGVTLSGGEALLWPEFVCALCDRLHERGVSTCIETTSYASWETYWQVASRMDLMLLDLKHWDSARHQEVTGVALEPIVRNSARVIERGANVLMRIPVIPGFNFDAADPAASAEGFSRRLREVGAPRVQLLPYHTFGEGKYARLERDYALAGTHILQPEDLTGLIAAFRERGIEAFM